MKKGFFFTIDAFLAASLLIGAILLITQNFSDEQSPEQTAFLAQDALLALSTIEVNELPATWVQDLIEDGTIDDPHVSVLVQIGKFWALNDTSNADALTSLVLEDMMPQNHGIALLIENDTIFSQINGTNNQVASAGRMVSGIAQGEALEGSTGVAFLQRISGKQTNAFAYFGGFVGQGNVSVRLDNLPEDINETNIREIVLEGEFDDDFSIYINEVSCGSFAGSSDLEIVSYNLSACASQIAAGNNTVELQFDSLTNGSVSGGFLRVAYVTEEFGEILPEGFSRQYLPDIDGVINLYDSLNVPGSLLNLTLNLHYEVTGTAERPIFFDIGNTTVYENNATGEINVSLSNSYLQTLLDFDMLSNTSVPIRFGWYEGNDTNASGNITDVYLITSRAGPMSYADIVGTTETRMEVAKRLAHNFTNIILAAAGNRQGLESYFASKSHDHSLTTDAQSLNTTIAAYSVQNPTQAERALCQAMEQARDELISSSGDRARSILLMTDGDTTKCCTGGQCTAEHARQDAIDVACDYYSSTGITYYTVGFGQEAANDPDVRSMLEEIANCTGGQFAESSNVTGLEEIYNQFAEAIAQSKVVYSYQRITEAANVGSHLFGDSHVETIYDPSIAPAGPTQLAITFQTPQFGSCTPTIEIANGLEVVEAQLVSYSGDLWTKEILIDGATAYNLSVWADDFALLGDPSRVLIPADLLSSGNHTFDIVLGANSSSSESCSLNNSLIYTALLNTSIGRGSVQPNAVGCSWIVEFEDETTQNFTIPSSYNGTKSCSYTSSSISYDPEDSYDEVVYQLFSNLDFDSDGRVFVNLQESDLEVIVTIISQVPYLWGPSIVRVVVNR